MLPPVSGRTRSAQACLTKSGRFSPMMRPLFEVTQMIDVISAGLSQDVSGPFGPGTLAWAVVQLHEENEE